MLPKSLSVRAIGAMFALASVGVFPVAAQTTDVPKTASPADAGKGGEAEAAYNNACRTCHSSKAGDNRLGPSLSGIVGRKAGAESGFAYSQAMKNSGLTWDAATIDKFIANPDSVVPGSNMKPFTGISDAAVRAQIITFLGAK